MRSIWLVFAFVALSACTTEPLQEIAALSATSPTTIFPGVLDLPLMEGHQLDAGCDGDDRATACLLFSSGVTAFSNKAYDGAEFAVRVYSAQLKKQGWTPLAYPFSHTFMSPNEIRCVDVQAVGVSYDHVTRAVVNMDLDPTAVACWEEPAGASAPVILPRILDLPVNQGDFLRDYSSQDSTRARVRFGKNERDTRNPYVDALVSRGWRISTRKPGEVALLGTVGERERCLTVRDMIVIVSRSDKSWAYAEFILLPDGARCDLEQVR